MARKVKKYNIKTRITSALRRVWLYSPMRREALKRAKDNGNFCEKCGVYAEKLQADHIIPVVPLKGRDNWDGIITRMMVGSEGLRCWCKPCHQAATSIDRQIRQKYKKKLDFNSK